MAPAQTVLRPAVPVSGADPFDTPLFNRLLDMIGEQNLVIKEMKAALEEQKEVMKGTKQVSDGQGEHDKAPERELQSIRDVVL